MSMANVTAASTPFEGNIMMFLVDLKRNHHAQQFNVKTVPTRRAM